LLPSKAMPGRIYWKQMILGRLEAVRLMELFCNILTGAADAAAGNLLII